MPSGDTAVLRLWVYPVGEATAPDDWHYVSLRDEADSYYVLDHWQSDPQEWGEWELRQYDISGHIASLAGQTVTLYIGTWSDDDDDAVTMFVDDVVIEVGL